MVPFLRNSPFFTVMVLSLYRHSILVSSFSFSSQSSNFQFPAAPPFLVVGFVEENEVDEVGEGARQVRVREKLEKACSCILVPAGVVVLSQKVGCASGDGTGNAEVIVPCVAVLHMPGACRCAACMQWVSTVHEGDQR